MTIGISGHQDLGSPKEVAWISARLRNELSKRTFSRGVSSLAVGADQLFAHIVLDLHHALEVVLPCRGYEKTFKNDDMRKVTKSLAGCLLSQLAHAIEPGREREIRVLSFAPTTVVMERLIAGGFERLPISLKGTKWDLYEFIPQNTGSSGLLKCIQIARQKM